jgi:hypothetical protein
LFLVTLAADELRQLSRPDLHPAQRVMLSYDVEQDGKPHDHVLAVQVETEPPAAQTAIDRPVSGMGIGSSDVVPGAPPLAVERVPAAAAELQAWVFTQHQVWVDARGREREIEFMPIAEVEAAIAHCAANATRICTLVADAGTDERAIELDTWMQETVGNAFDEALRLAHEQLVDLEAEADRWLEQTPLLLALERRRATIRKERRAER